MEEDGGAEASDDIDDVLAATAEDNRTLSALLAVNEDKPAASQASRRRTSAPTKRPLTYLCSPDLAVTATLASSPITRSHRRSRCSSRMAAIMLQRARMRALILTSR